MAEDYRRITLNQKEFLLALDAHRRARIDFMPNGEILDYKAIGEDGLSVTVRMAYGKNVNEVALTYKFADILPALLKFCTENNLKLPETGQRSIVTNNGLVSLVIRQDV